jgi:dUTP pyrophosphatase
MAFQFSISSQADTNKHGLAKKRYDDAGWDIPAYLPEGPTIIPARSSALIPTAIKTHFPASHVALVRARSGLSVKNNIEIGAGVIDASWEGFIKVKLYNHGDSDVTIEDGMRIAQLLFVPIYCGPVVAYQTQENIRGEQGFGSSGLF